MILKGTDSSSSSIFFLSKSEIITNISKGRSAASSIVFFGQIIVENANQCKIKGHCLKTLNTFYSNREMLLRQTTIFTSFLQQAVLMYFLPPKI